MPTILGDEFEPCRIIKPPAMSAPEVLLWHKFQREHCEDWLRVFYNVRVGKGIPQTEEVPNFILKDWILSTQHRIDALVETKDNIIIVEVRRLAGRAAFGALILYGQLWAKDPQITKPVRLAVVTDYCFGQMLESFKENGIEVYLQEP